MQEFNKIAYSIKGDGGKICLLLHNAGGNHKMMDPFAIKINQSVIGVDLPGHGMSASCPSDFTVQDIAKKIGTLCGHLKISKINLIGLNYGGNVGIELALQAPALVEKLILLEPPICMDQWIVEEVEKHIIELDEMEPKSYAKKLVDSVLKSKNSNFRNLAEESFVSTPKSVQKAIYRNLLIWDKEFQVGKKVVSCPSFLLQTNHPFSSKSNLEKKFSNLSIETINESGPWMTLDVPDQLYSAIRPWLM